VIYVSAFAAPGVAIGSWIVETKDAAMIEAAIFCLAAARVGRKEAAHACWDDEIQARFQVMPPDDDHGVCWVRETLYSDEARLLAGDVDVTRN
jgi:hypothetical protein